ncbi:hypothetical protein NSK_005602 [Nannochloropsis salina CCMP1776]|uniref:Uncharacterized protein n=1 Tax=Nannochloropsis salina CCMP1776 TaxID=1027361 RepID=A0A4D9CV40_9STRA|nr:hypothetical protein NSK_005602 [Nannochloropsis salina CCMP1776]|eukprot:TFJ83080.1 hypothetical protein NSK_005602 [Nannochloropsis salina CCMP1776]
MPPSGPTPLEKIDSNVSVEMLNRADRAAPTPFLKATKSFRAHSTRLFKPVKGFHERDDFHILLFASFCLCFNAGFVNTVTMSSYFAMTTSHVTGLVAKTSIALADADWHYVYVPAVTFLCFLLGAMLSGYTISRETFYMDVKVHTNLAFPSAASFRVLTPSNSTLPPSLPRRAMSHSPSASWLRQGGRNDATMGGRAGGRAGRRAASMRDFRGVVAVRSPLAQRERKRSVYWGDGREGRREGGRVAGKEEGKEEGQPGTVDVEAGGSRPLWPLGEEEKEEGREAGRAEGRGVMGRESSFPPSAPSMDFALTRLPHEDDSHYMQRVQEAEAKKRGERQREKERGRKGMLSFTSMLGRLGSSFPGPPEPVVEEGEEDVREEGRMGGGRGGRWEMA